ncbi:AAEL017127-PA [Aedes aegypti]|uniref:AAEL017127-PA n=1 Tax=Aedes aegypti TaxID=7159 RepID=J9HHR3_AEDAE|nr:AAEL017127-PA [Aedes aegypti]
MKVLVDYHHPEECLFDGAGPLSNRAHSYSYYCYRNHPSYRQLAATLGSGFKSRISRFLTLLRRRQLQYHRSYRRNNDEGEPSERQSPTRRTFEDRSFNSYCKRPKAKREGTNADVVSHRW